MALVRDGAQAILSQIFQLTPSFTALTKPFDLALWGNTSNAPLDPGGSVATGPATVTGEIRGNNTTVAGTPAGNYARVPVNSGNHWDNPTLANPSQMVNSGIIQYGTASANWADGVTLWVAGFVLYEGVASAADRGVWHGAFDLAKPVLSGDTVSIAAGNLQLRLE